MRVPCPTFVPNVGKHVVRTLPQGFSKTIKRAGDVRDTRDAVEAPHEFTDQNWRRKVAIALQVRRASQVARRGKALTFPTGRFPFNNHPRV